MLIYDRAVMTSRVRTPEGYLLVDARFSRTGIQKYLRMELGLDGDPYEVIRVYRPPEEVFSQEAMDSLGLKPVTDDHPSGDVTAQNARELAIGWSEATIYRDGDYTRGKALITDAIAVEKIDSGKVEMSPGYKVDLEFTSGIAPDGSAYDAIQRKIRGNHIALVDAGRCGGECRILDRSVNDCGGPGACECASCQRRDKELHMSDKPENKGGYVVDGVPIDTVQDAKQVIDRLQNRIEQDKDRMIELRNEVTSAMDKHRKRERELEDEVATLKGKLSDAEVEKRAEARVGLIMKAADFLPDDYETGGKSSAQIAKDAIVAAYEDQNIVAGCTDEQILAMFRTLDAAPQNNGQQLGRVLTPKNRQQTQDNGYGDYNSRLQDAWKPDAGKDASKAA